MKHLGAPRTGFTRADKGGIHDNPGCDENDIREYAEAMKAGTVFPPLLVCKDGAGTYWLADGFHRLHGAREAGIDALDCEVTPGSKRDAVLLAAGANAEHGLRRTNADKRRSVLTLLKDAEWGKWSNRKIADFCAVTHGFVNKIKAEVDTVSTPDKSTGVSASKTKVDPSKTAGIEDGEETEGWANLNDDEDGGQVPAKPEPVLDGEPA